MVAGFRRSLSFSTPSPRRTPPPEKSYHVRSISLPCKSHPVLSQLKDKINELRKWESQLELTDEASSSDSLCHGLTHLKDVHYCLDDLLHLPQTQESLRGRSQWIENLLEDFLRFVDVYDVFRATLFSLKEAQSSAQVSLRRRNESNIASYVKACSKNDKDLRKLIRSIGKWSSPALNLVNSADAELASVLSDVTQVTVSVSLALFHGISSSLSLSASSSSSSSSSGSCMMMGCRIQKPKKDKGILEFQEARLQSLRWLTKKVDQKEEEKRVSLSSRLQALDDCIGRIESGSEKVFRSLMNTRVSLLNVLTQ